MSIFSWLFSKPASQKPAAPAQRQAAPQKTQATAPGAVMSDLKQQRQERRDHLYSVVRDVMLRSEVLASHYKFKVLSLDTQGRQFLVLVDLLGEPSLHAAKLAGMEDLISSSAAQRHALQVKSVYWRHAQVAMLPAAVAPTATVVGRQPSPEAPLRDVEAATPRGRGGAKVPGFEPIGADEVLAFKNAIANKPSATPQASADAVHVSGLRNAAAMSGFEDTQLLEPDDTVSPLSHTQFGDL